MFERILVPLDGSKLAEEALRLAVRMARVASSELVLTRAVEVEMMVMPAEFEIIYHEQAETVRQRDARAYLQAIQTSEMCKDIPTQIVTQAGNPAAVILDTAAEKACDLIVMTTHGYRGLTRWLLGNVTERVLRNASCPVLVLRKDRLIQHILVPLDGSAHAETALAPAIEVAERLNATLTLLRVNDSLSRLDHSSLTALDQYQPGMAEEMRVAYAQQGEEYLAAIRARLDTLVPVNILTTVGKPAENILDVAKYEECDLIVMSTHGRSGMRRWVYGSVTEKVLHSADTPLLIVRSKLGS